MSDTNTTTPSSEPKSSKLKARIIIIAIIALFIYFGYPYGKKLFTGGSTADSTSVVIDTTKKVIDSTAVVVKNDSTAIDTTKK